MPSFICRETKAIKQNRKYSVSVSEEKLSFKLRNKQFSDPEYMSQLMGLYYKLVGWFLNASSINGVLWSIVRFIGFVIVVNFRNRGGIMESKERQIRLITIIVIWGVFIFGLYLWRINKHKENSQDKSLNFSIGKHEVSSIKIMEKDFLYNLCIGHVGVPQRGIKTPLISGGSIKIGISNKLRKFYLPYGTSQKVEAMLNENGYNVYNKKNLPKTSI